MIVAAPRLLDTGCVRTYECVFVGEMYASICAIARVN
jgi:hypothetical protein